MATIKQRLILTLMVTASATILPSCTGTLTCNKVKLSFPHSEQGFGINVTDGGRLVASQSTPAFISIKPEDSLHNTTMDYSSAYNTVRRTSGGMTAKAEVTTDNGSIFEFTDRYSAEGEAIVVRRQVKVVKAAAADIGFESAYAVNFNEGDGAEESYDFFIPSMIYKDVSAVRPEAVGADLSVDRMLIKETRSGLPLAMIRDRESGRALTLIHYHPQIDVAQNPGGGKPGDVNDQLLFGSIGYSRNGRMAVEYHYPSLEGPRSYEPGYNTQNGWLGRFHEVSVGHGHSYDLALLASSDSTYTDAMASTFTAAYTMQNPPIADIDIESHYQDNIDLFKAEFKSLGTGQVKAAGLPWSLDLPYGTNREGISFQMGFVGQQIAVGYHLYRYGKDNDDAEAVSMGESIVDFWTSPTIMSSYFPTVWWDPADNETAGRRRDYPSFLRCFVDGMEGLLDACRISEAYDDVHRNWEDALLQVADNLVAKQNDDGSFYRAYRPDGEVETGGDRNCQGTSKVNTPVAVRFLVKMYEHTGDNKFRDAAVKAAEFSYNELYVKLGKYVGGTPDNPNTVDKEAAIFAMYAFNAIHELTGEERYLKAAEHAALSVMSWAYCYDFAIPNANETDTVTNPFANGGTLAYSIIATGHSGADNFIGYVFFELYKLYVKTGNMLYCDMAKFIEHNSKLNTNYDGKLPYKYRAFMPEATNIADLAFRSVSLWLPWCSIANIEPVVQLEEAFGEKDIKDITLSVPELREKLKDYGVGGRKMVR